MAAELEDEARERPATAEEIAALTGEQEAWLPAGEQILLVVVLAVVGVVLRWLI